MRTATCWTRCLDADYDQWLTDLYRALPRSLAGHAKRGEWRTPAHGASSILLHAIIHCGRADLEPLWMRYCDLKRAASARAVAA